MSLNYQEAAAIHKFNEIKLKISKKFERAIQIAP